MEAGFMGDFFGKIYQLLVGVLWRLASVIILLVEAELLSLDWL